MEFPKNMAKLRRPACCSPSQYLCLYSRYSSCSLTHVALRYFPLAFLRPPGPALFNILCIFSLALHTSSPWKPLLSEILWFCLRGETCILVEANYTKAERHLYIFGCQRILYLILG